MVKTVNEHLLYLRNQTHLITLIKEKNVKISSIYTLDEGFETMVFVADDFGSVINWDPLETKHYSTYEDMRAGHFETVKEWENKK